ncbi:MAG: MMPL family transporter [Verrucomicrobiales bacterium]|nr:MMPL family transporter [Verrucomicrobiales bacterium]
MLRFRWPWVLVALLIVAGLARLRLDTEVLHLLPGDLPAVRGLLLQQRYFAPARGLMITVQGEDPDRVSRAAEAVASALGGRSDLAREVRWRPPWREHPEDALENLAWLWLQQPPGSVRDLVQRLQPGRLEDGLQSARERLATSLDPMDLAREAYDPLGLTRIPGAEGVGGGFEEGTGLFANPDGTFRVVFVEPARSELNYRDVASWLDSVRAVARDSVSAAGMAGGEVRMGFTGSPAFVAEISAGMERDLKNSVLSTVVLIALLFWMAHRTWRPLGWLLVSLGLILVVTLALGGLLFGTLNVLSVGFAAVLLGLAVDYGLVGYQEAAASPGSTPEQVRREVSRGVWYSAGTTAGTFLLLGFTGLPGLARLGQLTALGLLVGAVVMLYVFLPRVCPVVNAGTAGAGPDGVVPVRTRGSRSLWPTAILVAGVGLLLAWRGIPVLTTGDDPLRPRSSSAYAAMDELKAGLGRAREPLRLLFRGPDLDAVSRQLDAARATLAQARERGTVGTFDLPDGFWPRPDHASENAPSVRDLVLRGPRLRAAVLEAGFKSNAVEVADGLLRAWPKLVASGGSQWPSNATARWLTGQFVSRAENGDWLALGAVSSGPEGIPGEALGGLPDSVLVSSWDTLSQVLVGHVKRRITVLSILIAAALVGCLWMAFRRWREVLLSLGALFLSFALLLAAMAAVHGSWNLLSLVAIPLLLGTSVDSTIHIQLALRRHRGDGRAVWRTTGRALLLCAAANIAGFGSLAWSSNLGLASLDVVCAVGVACVFVVCAGLLPAWWRAAGGVGRERPESGPPSALYGPGLWKLGGIIARILPDGVASWLARAGAALYRLTRPDRVAVVTANLRPVVGHEPGIAERAARDNFRQFALKLVDLWRQEAGVSFEERVRPGGGWEQFSSARSGGRGVLLVTPHLGNWELGTVLLKREGVRPLVLTAPEPGGRFTELRAAARARQGVDTLVVGEDPFAFVEVIRRLQDGGMVALLLDRPPEATAVSVEFLGLPFRASVAVAELARASGAAVLPVYIVREGTGYRAEALEPLAYDRRALGSRDERVAFTGRILRAFEPAVRQFPDQWFHFVPVWHPGESSERSGSSSS